MTLEQMIALLTAKFSGVRKDGLAQLARVLMLQATTEEEGQALVDKISDSQATEFVKDWRKEVDAEVNKGIDTFKKKNQTPKPDPDKDPELDPKPKDTDPNDLATIVKEAIAAQLKPLQDELSGYKAESVSKVRKSALEEKLKEAPETYRNQILKNYDRMSFENEDSFNEYLTETETDLTEFNQELANAGLGKFPKPGRTGGGAPPEEIPADVAAFVKSMDETGGSNLGGKEV